MTLMTWLSRMHRLHAPWMAWCLAMVLVTAPGLARMHEVLHAPGWTSAHTSAIAASSCHEAPADHQHSHALNIADWFGDHDAQDCLLLDQLTVVALSTLAVVGTLADLTSVVPQWLDDAHLLPTRSPVFAARAPPAVFLV